MNKIDIFLFKEKLHTVLHFDVNNFILFDIFFNILSANEMFELFSFETIYGKSLSHLRLSRHRLNHLRLSRLLLTTHHRIQEEIFLKDSETRQLI
jgi:hypothetical protein